MHILLEGSRRASLTSPVRFTGFDYNNEVEGGEDK